MKLKVTKDTKPDVIEVTWIDATSTDQWHDSIAGIDDGLETCATVGYFLRYTKRSIQISAAYQPGHAGRVIGGLWSIPRKCVVKIRKLK